MTGIIANAMKFKPNCRYGHGDLMRTVFRSNDDSMRSLFLPTAKQLMEGAPLMADGSGFTVALYRCPKCGYLEIFDDEVENG